MFIAALFVITPNWKQPRCLPRGKVNCGLSLMGYYSALKRNTDTCNNIERA